MSDITDAAAEAAAIAKGDAPAARIYMNGHFYVPEAEITRLRAQNEALVTVLWDIHAICNNYPHFFWWPVRRIKRFARAALAKAGGGRDEDQ